MSINMDQVFLVALGAALGIGGYLLKRWWEGQPAREKIQDLASLVKLQKDLTSDSVSLEALEDLKRDISERGLKRTKGEAEVLQNIAGALEHDSREFRIEDTLINQNQMNRYAFYLADLADKEMEFLIDALEFHLDESEAIRFRKSQRAWSVFARRQADFSSGMFEGGSMRPMIYSSELRALTIERAAKLKDEIRERHKLDSE